MIDAMFSALFTSLPFLDLKNVRILGEFEPGKQKLSLELHPVKRIHNSSKRLDLAWAGARQKAIRLF
jgi:hypothetical protein